VGEPCTRDVPRDIYKPKKEVGAGEEKRGNLTLFANIQEALEGGMGVRGRSIGKIIGV